MVSNECNGVGLPVICCCKNIDFCYLMLLPFSTVCNNLYPTPTFVCFPLLFPAMTFCDLSPLPSICFHSLSVAMATSEPVWLSGYKKEWVRFECPKSHWNPFFFVCVWFLLQIRGPYCIDWRVSSEPLSYLAISTLVPFLSGTDFYFCFFSPQVQ